MYFSLELLKERNFITCNFCVALRFRYSISHFPLNSGGIACEWRNSTPRYAHHQSEEMEILNILFTRVGIESRTCHVCSRMLVLLRHNGHQKYKFVKFFFCDIHIYITNLWKIFFIFL